MSDQGKRVAGDAISSGGEPDNERSASTGLAAKEILSRTISVIFGIVAAAIIAELGLRLIGFSRPDFYVPDLDRGHALRPGASGWFTDEGRAYVEVNSDGLHDREHRKAKPANTLRVAVLGDSFAEAKQVPLEDNFGSVLERELAKCDRLRGKKVEVLNFGVAAYGTVQELVTLRERVWQYSPDIVVLAFYSGNDVTDNAARWSRDRKSPVFVRRGDNWILDDSFRNLPSFQHAYARQSSLPTRIRDYSRLLQLIESVRRLVSPEGTVVAEEDRRMYRPPVDSDLREGWEATEYTLATMNREVQAHHAMFLLVTLSNSIQVYPDPRVREAFAKRVGVVDLFYPEHRLSSFAKAQGIDLLCLAEPFQRYADSHRMFLHGFKNAIMGYGHWNREGHRLAGTMIAARLCAMLGEVGHSTLPESGAR